jgi:hypothetical protein
VHKNVWNNSLYLYLCFCVTDTTEYQVEIIMGPSKKEDNLEISDQHDKSAAKLRLLLSPDYLG